MIPPSEHFYQCLLEQAPDALVAVDGAGLSTFVNREAERVLGSRRRELLGQGLSVLVAGAGLLPDGPVGTLDLACLDKGGREFPVEVARSLVETPAGSWVMLTFRDVTVRRQAEES